RRVEWLKHPAQGVVADQCRLCFPDRIYDVEAPITRALVYNARAWCPSQFATATRLCAPIRTLVLALHGDRLDLDHATHVGAECKGMSVWGPSGVRSDGASESDLSRLPAAARQREDVPPVLLLDKGERLPIG